MDFQEGQCFDVGVLVFYSRCICEILYHMIVFKITLFSISFNFNFISSSLHFT